MGLRIFAFLATALLLTACPSDPTTPLTDSGRSDSSRRDSGSRDSGGGGDCGDLGQMCCIGSTPCSPGTRCGSDRSCCATPGGASCGGPSDCCGDFDCVGGACCSPEGSSCRTPSDCCADLICSPTGQCQAPAGDCGRSGETCCPGDECRSGLACVSGACTPCGTDGDICCRPPSQCADALICAEGRCGAAPSDCGSSGQPCCDGECTGTLVCDGGMCEAPPMGSCGGTNCGDCQAEDGCGWCNDGSGTCMPGASGGPTAGSCGDWDWFPSACPMPAADCNLNTDCDECTRGVLSESSTCGWCADSGTCLDGTSTGPGTGSCTDWSWLSFECTDPGDDDCTMNTNCSDCTLGTEGFLCGWCGDTGTCARGDSDGPDVGSCGGSSWAWLESECSGVDPCISATTCGECTGRLECGWCASSSRCLVGGGSGPDVGTCGDWDYVGGDCAMCNDVMGSCASDSECCGSLSCRRGFSFSTRCCVEPGDSCSGASDCCGFTDCISGSCVAVMTSGRSCYLGDCESPLMCSGTRDTVGTCR